MFALSAVQTQTATSKSAKPLIIAQQGALGGIPVEKLISFRIPEHAASLRALCGQDLGDDLGGVCLGGVCLGGVQRVPAVKFIIVVFGVGAKFSNPDTTANNAATLSAARTHVLGAIMFNVLITTR